MMQLSNLLRVKILKFTELSEQYTVEARIMGLLDKVDNMDDEKPAKAKAAKAVAKAKAEESESSKEESED